MVNQASSLDLDPAHTSCIGGRTVLTCRSCAGNAPRNSICTSCSGRGFNIFVCTRCNPVAAINHRTSATTSETSTPDSVSRSSSTSVSSFNDRLAPASVRGVGDRDGGSGGGRLETNTNQPRRG
ncbi:hypothetical protein BDW59DRAFT_168006 [Aspergillus cavernicola]|uniref:Uncharacterized protein n=1 Tax=Aspergillus cavernicola TaxID=176166 RepID=A0ABR4H7M9_9EURO